MLPPKILCNGVRSWVIEIGVKNHLVGVMD